MNIEYSDIVSQNYIFYAIVCFAIAAITRFLSGKSESIAHNPAPFTIIFPVAVAAIGLIQFFYGSYNHNVAHPYFERFEAFYDNAAMQQGFWIAPDLQELATHGTVNNEEVENDTLPESNKAIQLLKDYFPSDDFNVTNLDTLRLLKQTVQKCVTGPDKVDYLRRLSELPVSRLEKNRIESELTVLYFEDCKAGGERQK
ncbi:MAG: hypothetical protein AWU57_331 [Marinobacter sp. T13-3]|nr:MAG: hypothetical protein AWU57_331 [Marinobacter sp. T13-3]